MESIKLTIRTRLCLGQATAARGSDQIENLLKEGRGDQEVTSNDIHWDLPLADCGDHSALTTQAETAKPVASMVTSTAPPLLAITRKEVVLVFEAVRACVPQIHYCWKVISTTDLIVLLRVCLCAEAKTGNHKKQKSFAVIKFLNFIERCPNPDSYSFLFNGYCATRCLIHYGNNMILSGQTSDTNYQIWFRRFVYEVHNLALHIADLAVGQWASELPDLSSTPRKNEVLETAKEIIKVDVKEEAEHKPFEAPAMPEPRWRDAAKFLCISIPVKDDDGCGQWAPAFFEKFVYGEREEGAM